MRRLVFWKGPANLAFLMIFTTSGGYAGSQSAVLFMSGQ